MKPAPMPERAASPDTGAPQGPGRAALRERFAAVRETTAALVRGLSAEDCQVQSMPDASPVKWHLGHTAWFFETFVLQRHAAGYRPFHPEFRMLFNSYYNSVGDKHPRPERGMLTRPSLDDVLAYRAHVDHAMRDAFERQPGAPDFDALTDLGLHHEQQHQELILTDLLHLFSRNPLRPAYRTGPSPAGAPTPSPSGWTRYDGGIVRVGHQGPGFAFDNEQPAHDVLLAPYELADRLVTQAEYLEFMRDGGYRRPELWLSLGWEQVRAQDWQAPFYWETRDGEWRRFTLRGLLPLDPGAPVCHLSYFEADAYARWAGARLPREAEWEWAARCLGEPEPSPQANLLESGMLMPRPARATAAGPAQMYGDAWEWTSSAYDAYPGFTPGAGAIGEYNGKFMCNQFVLRGGSFATPRSHIRPSYRNFFPPDARWQFTGLRLARDAARVRTPPAG